jgi:hypothetical protein
MMLAPFFICHTCDRAVRTTCDDSGCELRLLQNSAAQLPDLGCDAAPSVLLSSLHDSEIARA